jgi:Holliday junction resolvase RusA-like endonuclease
VTRASFIVKGHPAPKGSRKFLGAGGASKESSDRCKPWVEAIVFAARGQRPGGRTLEPPYRIGLGFWMPRPEGPKYGWPSSDGDLDKLARAVLDGLVQGDLILDDRHVVQLDTSKAFAEPGRSTGVSIVIL